MANFLKSLPLSQEVISSILLIIILITIRMLLVRLVRESQMISDVKRNWIVQIKNTSIILIIIGLFFVWGSELRTFALSIVAIAAALVLATKELILCFLGGIMRATTRPFKLGDRIEMHSPVNLRGDVINQTFLTTTLFEIGPGRSAHQYTGKTVIIPNSIFLTAPIFNESKASSYRLHTFSIFRPNSINIKRHQEVLLKAANTVCSDYIEQAQSYLQNIEDVEGLEAPTAEPRVFVSFPDKDTVELIVRIPIHSIRAGKTEQAILSSYIDAVEP
jgi:small-conductance mechanosensitive channel